MQRRRGEDEFSHLVARAVSVSFLRWKIPPMEMSIAGMIIQCNGRLAFLVSFDRIPPPRVSGRIAAMCVSRIASRVSQRCDWQPIAGPVRMMAGSSCRMSTACRVAQASRSALVTA
jgi:hypothetical protein